MVQLAYHPKPDKLAEFLDSLSYPMLCSPKYDGIRVYNNTVMWLTRDEKPIPNFGVRRQLEQSGIVNLDGEIVLGTDFQMTSSVFRGQRVPETFQFYVFDFYQCGDLPYKDRLAALNAIILPDWCHVVQQTWAWSTEDVLLQMDISLRQKYPQGEGVMLRRPDAKIRYNRSTKASRELIAIKATDETVGTIVGYEQMVSSGDKTRQEYMRLVPKLGSFVVNHPQFAESFTVGSGFTDSQRLLFWEKRDSFIGQQVRFRYVPCGIKDAPRHPVFLEVLKCEF